MKMNKVGLMDLLKELSFTVKWERRYLNLT